MKHYVNMVSIYYFNFLKNIFLLNSNFKRNIFQNVCQYVIIIIILRQYTQLLLFACSKKPYF